MNYQLYYQQNQVHIICYSGMRTRLINPAWDYKKIYTICKDEKGTVGEQRLVVDIYIGKHYVYLFV